MNQHLVTFLVLYCFCANLSASDQQTTGYKIDQIHQSDLLNEPLIQTIIVDQTAEESILLDSPKASRKIEVRYPRQIFQNRTVPFTRSLINNLDVKTLEGQRFKVGRRPELNWHITMTKQIQDYRDQKLLTGGAFIYETRTQKSREILYKKITE